MPKHQRSRANTMCMAHLWQCQWHFTCTTDIITMAIIIAFSGSQQCRGPWPWLFFSVGAKFNTFGFKSQDMRRCQGLALKKTGGNETGKCDPGTQQIATYTLFSTLHKLQWHNPLKNKLPTHPQNPIPFWQRATFLSISLISCSEGRKFSPPFSLIVATNSWQKFSLAVLFFSVKLTPEIVKIDFDFAEEHFQSCRRHWKLQTVANQANYINFPHCQIPFAWHEKSPIELVPNWETHTKNYAENRLF